MISMMNLISKLKKLLALSLILTVGWALPTLAQEGAQKPVMENVFFNVVWGSATGALLGAGIAVTDSKDKSNPDGVRSAVFQGATGGGIIGLGVGIWLVFSGITFDPGQSTIFPQDFSLAHEDSGASSGLAASAPFSFQTSPGNPLQITGFKARVLNWKF